LRERGLQVCQIGAFGYNPLSTDREGQAKQKALIEQAIPLARETGCPYIVICGGNYHPSGFGAGDPRNDSPAALDEVAQELAPLLALTERHGARITIEPYLKTAINSPERFLALWHKAGSDALRVNVDVTSLYGYRELLDSTSLVQHVCEALAGHYGLVHIKEVSLAEGFHIHAGLAPLGAGRTDWEQVLRLIARHVPDDSWVILEHCLSAEQARADLAYLRGVAAKAALALS
jgi:sugar phosphate isomerase/epimerase